MVLVLILGYVGLAAPLLLGLLRAATCGERADPADHAAPGALRGDATATR